MHIQSNTSILYFGTPVILISTVNADGTYNLAPFSSVFWLGWRCIIGISKSAKTAENLLRTKECVVNLPSVNEVAAVNRLALTTGTFPVPPQKVAKGYTYAGDKFKLAALTHQPSTLLTAPRVLECPIQMEAKVAAVWNVGEDDEKLKGRILTIELDVLKVHVEETVIMDGNPDKVDPDKWRPLLMSFQHFYGLNAKLGISNLASISEHLYQMKK
ncbi:MAG: hypothetical protein RL172_2445 [Bacteroidota bacterium]|jgi:flavin reductase (DIM6/NTAB) family NADH-FMN oxidoreductase RutF